MALPARACLHLDIVSQNQRADNKKRTREMFCVEPSSQPRAQPPRQDGYREHYIQRELKEIGTCIVYKKDISCKGGNVSMCLST